MSRDASETGAPPGKTEPGAKPDLHEPARDKLIGAASPLADLPHATPPPIATLRLRADFLKVASARRFGTAGFLLQARQRGPGEMAETTIRIGYTCSKKLGNAVIRNRAKRRLRALAREVMPQTARPGWDYVLVGRPEATATRDYAAMIADLCHALNRIHDSPIRDAAATIPKGRRRGKSAPPLPQAGP